MPEVMNAPSTPVDTGHDGEAAVTRILSSPQFARADTQRKLLQYLWEHRERPVSEYAVATEALGRHTGFDPTTDASVRVHISRLRRKLKDYYAESGESELLFIPTGTHQLVLVEPAPGVSQEAVEAETEENIESSDVRRPWIETHATLIFGIASVLLLACIVLSVLLFYEKKDAAWTASNRPNAFWGTFLAGNAPISIILPTPTFFSFRDHPSFKFRSTKVNTFDELSSDPDFQALAAKLGAPGLDQSYTVTWDTLAAIDVARYLDRIGQGNRISFQVTRDSSLLAFERSNVVVLGTEHTLRSMQEYTNSMNFSMSNDEKSVINAHPRSGESAVYARQIQGRDRHVEPSIVALLPGQAPGLKVLMLESRDTNGMVSLLTSNAGSRAVEDMWRAHGAPKFFEMVTFTEMEGNDPLRSWPIALHEYTKSSSSKGM